MFMLLCAKLLVNFLCVNNVSERWVSKSRVRVLCDIAADACQIPVTSRCLHLCVCLYANNGVAYVRATKLKAFSFYMMFSSKFCVVMIRFDTLSFSRCGACAVCPWKFVEQFQCEHKF